MQLFVFAALCLVATVAAKFDICSTHANGKFFRDHSDCKRYIACVNGVSMYGSCPDQFLFNGNTSSCDYSNKVQCASCPRQGLTTFAVEGSCRHYVRCIAGHAEYLECPGELFYDHSTGTCNLQSQVDCTELLCPGTGTYNMASNEDCAAYISCSNGQARRLTCENGYYNPRTQKCDARENVACNIRPPRKDLLTDVTVSCPPTGEHFYPHPADCNHYYLCVNGVSAILDCGPELHYDIVRQTCDLPSRATCITQFN